MTKVHKNDEKKEKARVQVQLDKDLKEGAEYVLDSLGISSTTAIRILYKQILSKKEFPLRLEMSEEEKFDMELLGLAKKQEAVLIDTPEKFEDFLDEER